MRNLSGDVYLVGGGMASLAAASFLIRDAGMAGERIHVLEKEHLPGGACDGYRFEQAGYIMRGDHKLDASSVCLKDLLSWIPASGGSSVLEELEELNRRDPNYSLCRVTKGKGEDVKPEGPFGLSDRACLELLKLFYAADEELAEKRIADVLTPEVLSSNFWLLWRTTWGYRDSHSALEFKTALQRHVGNLAGLPDLKFVRYAKHNLYESMVLPIRKWLEEQGVEFRYGVHVTDVAFDCAMNRKRATRIDIVTGDEDGCIDLTEQDGVFITLGSVVENSSRGSQEEPAAYIPEVREGGGFDLWKRIALQHPSFGHPEVFCMRPEETTLMSATVTLTDGGIIPWIKKLSRRDPFSGKTVTGGIVTAQDSPWLLSWEVPRQPLFLEQPKEHCVVWIYGLHADRAGAYIDKPMGECTGEEICEEWLYHLGVPSDQIENLAVEHARTIPVRMPFATAPLLPREPGDRPDVVPEGAENFAFLGQFTEVEREAANSVEFAVRSGMEAVYTLFETGRKVPEVTGRAYDLRQIFAAASALRDGRSIRDLELRRGQKSVAKSVIKLARGTEIEKLLRENRLI